MITIQQKFTRYFSHLRNLRGIRATMLGNYNKSTTQKKDGLDFMKMNTSFHVKDDLKGEVQTEKIASNYMAGKRLERG